MYKESGNWSSFLSIALKPCAGAQDQDQLPDEKKYTMLSNGEFL